jgi:hypothetical protein
MQTPELWTKTIERATMLYLDSSYDVHLTVGLQQIQESPGFRESLKLYIEQDSVGKARWEHLTPIMTEIEARKHAAHRVTEPMIVWSEWLKPDPAILSQRPPPTEEVLNWMRRMERATELYLLSDYDRLITEFYRVRRTDPQFQIQMTRFEGPNSMGATRWQRITSMEARIEWRRNQSWREIRRLDQIRQAQR